MHKKCVISIIRKKEEILSTLITCLPNIHFFLLRIKPHLVDIYITDGLNGYYHD